MLSEGLHDELKKDGVTVTTLCPGPTQTKLLQRADMQDTGLAHAYHMMSPDKVAAIGYAALMRGKGVVIAGFFNRLLAFSTRFFPRVMVVSFTRSLNQRRSSSASQQQDHQRNLP